MHHFDGHCGPFIHVTKTFFSSQRLKKGKLGITCEVTYYRCYKLRNYL